MDEIWLSIFLCTLIIRAFAVYREQSDKECSRIKFLKWYVFAFLWMVFKIGSTGFWEYYDSLMLVNFYLAMLVVVYVVATYLDFCFFTAMVQRAREANLAKKNVYWAIFPMLDISLGLTLLLRKKVPFSHGGKEEKFVETHN